MYYTDELYCATAALLDMGVINNYFQLLFRPVMNFRYSKTCEKQPL